MKFYRKSLFFKFTRVEKTFNEIITMCNRMISCIKKVTLKIFVGLKFSLGVNLADAVVLTSFSVMI